MKKTQTNNLSLWEQLCSGTGCQERLCIFGGVKGTAGWSTEQPHLMS